jgi:hypothetical protein
MQTQNALSISSAKSASSMFIFQWEKVNARACPSEAQYANADRARTKTINPQPTHWVIIKMNLLQAARTTASSSPLGSQPRSTATHGG